jgi:hypothetical protein
LTVLIGVFIGGMLLGAILGIAIMSILSYSKDLHDEDYPLRRASDVDYKFTDDELIELRASLK